jgi:hypothetical protein
LQIKINKYVEEILTIALSYSPECGTSSSEIWSRNTASDGLNVTPTHSSECGKSSSSSTETWSTKRPSGSDHDATMFFLQLRDKYSQNFNDKKKTIKTTLWRKIASEMNEGGYWVG